MATNLWVWGLSAKGGEVQPLFESSRGARGWGAGGGGGGLKGSWGSSIVAVEVLISVVFSSSA